MSDSQTHIGKDLQTLHRIGHGKFAHFVMTRSSAIHLIHDDLRVIIWPLQCNHNAINDLWIASNDSGASCNAILRIGHFDPLNISGLERTDRQQSANEMNGFGQVLMSPNRKSIALTVRDVVFHTI